jgi:hypothetical protein
MKQDWAIAALEERVEKLEDIVIHLENELKLRPKVVFTGEVPELNNEDR